MKKTIILMIIVISISILSGCINNSKTVVATNDSNNVSSEANEANVSSEANEANVSSEANEANVSSEANINSEIKNKQFVAKGADWCVPGEKLSEDSSFTIVGLTTYKGIDVCSAEKIYDTGKSVKYFSKDGKFEADESKSKSGNAYSEAKVEINTNKSK